MLSLQKCRELLGHNNSNLTDGQLALLREQLYALASVSMTVDRRMIGHLATAFESALRDLDASARAEAEERAAIAEFDGKLSRDQGERLALDRLRDDRRY